MCFQLNIGQGFHFNPGPGPRNELSASQEPESVRLLPMPMIIRVVEDGKDYKLILAFDEYEILHDDIFQQDSQKQSHGQTDFSGTDANRQ